MRERRLMSVARDDGERRRRLHQLFGEAARPLVLHARDLHGDRRGAFASAARRQIAPCGAQQRADVNAGMIVKAAVFESERRARHALRN